MANPNHKTSSSKTEQTATEDLIFDPKKMSFDDFIAQNAVLFIPGINAKMVTMGGLKLGLLPPIAQEFFIRWLFEVNRPRLIQGLDLYISYPLIKQCPLWKLIPMPYRNISLDKDTTAALGKLIPPNKRLKFQAIQ